ncbi:vacuolar protein sorting-associated protein 54 [Contarinia nasturtii]|uniref:vacuolar protein sorting-associated protein 54 n=1 Tax=Contarinia nasturtii TaxID=265458 RepID=UPI0012D47CB5|nr:vacuolar protein sorting-associated protein 54 [Contarinia nasturtii]XP_031617457.1 vacuolar protein sorting-associated protein 54 [Contarinia nasturtii]
MAKAFTAADKQQTWQTCNFCSLQTFKTSTDFLRHLRDRHCTREGGSYVCRYGYKGVCCSLPVDGVSDRDYESHVLKFHMTDTKRDAPEEWSVYMAAQNLPAVLNDPSRGKQSNIFTKKWGDSFVEKVQISPTHLLPDITYDHLSDYIKQIGKRYRRHVRLNQNIQSHEFAAQFSPTKNASPTNRSIEHQRPSTSSMISDISELNCNSFVNGNSNHIVSSSHASRKLTYEINDANLDDIPQIFVKPNLDFTNLETFDAVFPGICDADNKKSGRLLQEKLSHYLDIVEVLIAKQVSEKSSAFFHAMTSQDAIMENMNDASKNVVKMREKMKLLDEKFVKNAVNIVTLDRKRTHYGIIYDKLKLMQTVHQTQPMIQLLLGTQDYVAALDLISTTQEIVAQELIGIHCFKHLPSQLTEMERLVSKMLATEFEKYSTMDLSRPIGGHDDDDDDDRVYDEDKLICIVSGLLRQNNFSFIETYRDEAIVAIRALIKQLVIEVISTSDDERCLTGAGEVAQCLTIQEWIFLLKKATVLLLGLLRRIKRVLDVMHQVSEASAGKCVINSDIDETFDTETFLSESDHKKVEEKLKDIMHSICNYCSERCANLISSQSLEKHVASADEIKNLAEIIRAFSTGCEELTGIQRIPLAAALQAQATKFGNKFHTERKSKLSLLLDNERWKQVEVPAEYQLMIDRIADGDFSWSKNEINSERQAKPSTMLYVDAEPFMLVNSALILVQIISEYCQCAASLPMISTQLSRHLIDLLRTFNSKCCQLVLGAGALRVAGLTTITTGNLALVSRSLKLVIWFIPRIKGHFQQLEMKNANAAANSNESGAIVTTNNFINTGFDTIEKDFFSHIKEIETKVMTIVTTLVHNLLNNWTARPPVPSQSFRNISRHFIKLHEALSPILPEQQIHQLYRVVHKNFKDKLRELLIKYNIVNNGGPQCGMVTSELTFYMETLRTLKAMPPEELEDDTLNDIWV